MIGIRKSASIDKAIGVSICLLIGILPIAEYTVPVLLVLLSMIFGIRYIDRQSVKIAAPVIFYCVTQLGFMIYHPGWLILDETLATILVIIGLAAIPMSALFKAYFLNLRDIEAMVLIGILLICSVFAYQYLILDGCRVRAFSVGPLGPPVIMLPLSLFIISNRALNERFNILDCLVLFVLIVSMGAFLGARMSFYSCVLISFFLIVVLIAKHKQTFGLWIFLSLCCGVYAASSIDKCGDFNRISTHLKMLEILLPSVVFDEDNVELKPSFKQEVTLENTSKSTIRSAPSTLNNLTDLPVINASIALPVNKISSIYQNRLSSGILSTADANTQENHLNGKPKAVADNTQNQTLNNFISLESSSGDRLLMWLTAIEHFTSLDNFSSILLGSGRVFAKELQEPHPHTHNQFLSWLTCSGLLGLFAGVLLFGPLFLNAFNATTVFIFFSTCILGFLTDSPLFIRDTTSQFLIMLLFVQSLWHHKMQS